MYAKDHHQAVSFFPTNVMYFSRGLCREDHGKTKKIVYGITGS